MKTFTVKDDVFKTEPLFVTDCTYGDMQKYLNHRFDLAITDAAETTAGTMLTFGKAPWRVVWLRRSRDRQVLVHKLFHLVTRLCQDKGIPIVAHHPNGENGDETAAYLLEFFFVKAMAKI